jgi:hypothetical protein
MTMERFKVGRILHVVRIRSSQRRSRIMRSWRNFRVGTEPNENRYYLVSL